MKNLLNPAVIIGALPAQLTNGTTADATQVMADLNWIVNQVNGNAASLINTALINANNNFSAVQSGIAASAPANFPIASQVQNQAFNTLSSTLGTNTITARCAALPLNAYASGQVFTFLPAQTNTGPSNLTIDSAGSSIIFSNGATLVGGELKAGRPTVVEFDGSKLNILSNGQPRSKIINTTFDMSTATGTSLVITGVGFRPRSARMILGFSGGSASGCDSVGWSDGTNESCDTNYLGTGAAGQRSVDGVLGNGVQGGSTFQTFSISVGGSFTNDGCIVKNAKTGTPTGIVNVSFEFEG
jgi:hypothetical protein